MKTTTIRAKREPQGQEVGHQAAEKPDQGEAMVTISQSVWDAAKGLDADLSNTKHDLSNTRQELDRTQSDLDQVREELSLSRTERELLAKENQALKLKLGQAMDVMTKLQEQHHQHTDQLRPRVMNPTAHQWIEALRAPR
jgi:uncharacterized protein (DUF3084 family)